MPLRAVVFDYGNTLVSVDPALHSKRTDYADVVAVPGAERMTRHLESRGLVTREQGMRFLDRFLAIREMNRTMADESGDEIPASMSLVETFRAIGLPEPPSAEIVLAVTRFFSAEEELLQEIPGAAATLRALEERGIALALLSNATDGDSIRRGVERFGWGGVFWPLIVSSDIGVRKPRAEAFRAVLRDWPFAPSEIAVVGDSLRHDVGGAQALGLGAYHFTWIPNPWDPVYLGRIVPGASAATHPDLLRLLLEAAGG
ncbi:MAG TPA: HAD family hydrolase [Candidatus Eisenbacteria bacterium]|nr:HAD family hydrolase [Candidatus Eisenbacteria bacterium]